MRIRIGYDIVYECPQPTFMILMLNVHYSRVADLETPDYVKTSPSVPLADVHETLRSDRRVDPSRSLARLGIALTYPTYRYGMC